MHAEIGVIGGSGLYEMEGLQEVREVKVDTPFGPPSDKIMLGTLEGRRLAFLPRHGRGHRILPTEINFRANIYALKKLGVERVISVSAVGSMKEEIRPGHIVVPDQFYDLTKHRVSTFFGDGVVAHVGFADPVCHALSGELYTAGVKAGATMHKGGTYICMEGPQFSTRGESRIYRSWGVDVIGMTNVTEAKLAREAEVCYATLALATDYDCWHETEEDVTLDAVLAIIEKNVATAKAIIRETVAALPKTRHCQCGEAMKYSIMTSGELIPEETKKKLDIIIGKYVK
ncbi:MAG: S-methyl-5'-thioadenosine phosphorylase [Nitrospirae bacterium]|nr:S-methyl-5'-thioadenosine phosphorylase [Nitrospirota bacterium]MBI5695813.1 S-methyl-5'-thioadenosine phosphorylase [Nitrospirota bacterium]